MGVSSTAPPATHLQRGSTTSARSRRDHRDPPTHQLSPLTTIKHNHRDGLVLPFFCTRTFQFDCCATERGISPWDITAGQNQTINITEKKHKPLGFPLSKESRELSKAVISYTYAFSNKFLGRKNYKKSSPHHHHLSIIPGSQNLSQDPFSQLTSLCSLLFPMARQFKCLYEVFQEQQHTVYSYSILFS